MESQPLIDSLKLNVNFITHRISMVKAYFYKKLRKIKRSGGADGARTRDPLRDRQVF